MRCAIIEFNPVHGEIIPTLVLLLTRLKVDVDVYASGKIWENDPFVRTPGLVYKRRTISRFRYVLLRMFGKFDRYDLLVFNSLEIYGRDPAWLLRHLATLSGHRVLAIVHNPEGLKGATEYRAAFADRNRIPVVLSEFSSNNVSADQFVPWISPVYITEVESNFNLGSPTRFCVPGNMQHDRRNYRSLIDAVSELVRGNSRAFCVSIVGRASIDGAEIKEMVKSAGLDSYFSFHNQDLPYSDFYDRVAETHFMLPLIDTSAGTFQDYYKDKITSSMLLAIGFSIVPVMEAILARQYDVAAAALTYADGGLAGAMREAMSLSDVDYLEKQALLASLRLRQLSNSEATMSGLIHGYGAAAARGNEVG